MSGSRFDLRRFFSVRPSEFVVSRSARQSSLPTCSALWRMNARRATNRSSPGANEPPSATYVGEGDFHARAPTRFTRSDCGYKSAAMGQRQRSTRSSRWRMRQSPRDSTLTGTQQTLNLGGATPASLLLTTRYQPTDVQREHRRRGVRLQGAQYARGIRDGPLRDRCAHVHERCVESNRSALAVVWRGVSRRWWIAADRRVQAYYGFGRASSRRTSTPAEPTLTATPMQTYGALLVVAGTTNTRAIEGAIGAVKRIRSCAPARAANE